MRNTSLLTAVLIATLAVLTGCSRNPIAPTTETVAAPDAGPVSITVDQENEEPLAGGTPKERSITLTTTEEGSAVVGRFTIWVRKNSLKMPATITIKVADPEATECEIQVTPAAANDFRSPVVLYAAVADIAGFDYGTGSLMEWVNDWDWATDASSHPNQKNVVGHFAKLASKVKVSDGADKWKNKMGS